MSNDETTAASRELQQLLLETADLDEFLDDLAALAARTLPSASCGITLQRDGRPWTVSSSDERASQVDEIQYEVDNGPCLHSARHGEVVIIDEMAHDVRWDRFRSFALAAGVRSSMSHPMSVSPNVIGAINVYSSDAHAPDRAAQAALGAFSRGAERAIALAIRLADQTKMTEHLQAALTSRSTIDQAIGIVMGQNHCTADVAFGVLRQASHNRNVKLREVAKQIVIAIGGDQPTPPPAFRGARV